MVNWGNAVAGFPPNQLTIVPSILVQRCCWNEAAVARCVIIASECESRKFAEHFPAQYRPAKDEIVTAPAVFGSTIAVCGWGPVEFRLGAFLDGTVERPNRLA